MPALNVILRDEPHWPELAPLFGTDRLIHLGNDARIDVAGLPDGTSSGRPTVVMRFDLPDGRVVMAETTLRLFLTAADALKARFGDPRY